MNILFIVGPFPLLSETFILNQITGLLDRGHQVGIYATQPVADAPHADVERYRLLDLTRYRKPVPGGRIGRLLGGVGRACMLGVSHPGMLLRSITEAIANNWRLPINIYYDIASLRDLARYDILHCHFGFNGNRAMRLREIGALHGKLITTFHGVDVTARSNGGARHRYDRLFTHGDLFQPISERWRKRLIDLGCDESKIQVHRMGIDCTRFTFKSRTIEPGKPFKIVTIARFVEKKGLEYGIRAVARLREGHPEVEYTIVGDGPLRADLERFITELDIRDRIHLTGWQPQHRVVEILDDAHLFLAPSVTAANGDQEGIPVVLMEAMAMGLPVVATLHSGIPELVEDEVTGYLVPERDANALHQRIEHLCENPQLGAEMGRQGRAVVETRYNINVLNDRLVESYRHLLDTRS